MTTAALWTKHRPIAHKEAASFHIPGMDREDVRQEALLELWRAARAFDRSRGTFPPYARLRVHSHLVNLLRKATREKRAGRTVELPDVPSGGDTHGLVQLRLALQDLTQPQRDALAAHLNGTYDCRDRSVENHLYAARREIRKTAA